MRETRGAVYREVHRPIVVYAFVCAAYRLGNQEREHVGLQEDQNTNHHEHGERPGNHGLENVGFLTFHIHGGCRDSQGLRGNHLTDHATGGVSSQQQLGGCPRNTGLVQVLGGRDLQLREQRVGAGIRTSHCGTDPAQCAYGRRPNRIR